MICFITGIVVGLIVGWNFLPQPQRVKDYIDQLRSKLTK
jgi:hypothetical protein